MGNANAVLGEASPTSAWWWWVPGTWRPGREELGSGERWMARERFLALLCAGIKKSAALPSRPPRIGIAFS